jgi:hypothetical protein
VPGISDKGMLDLYVIPSCNTPCSFEGNCLQCAWIFMHGRDDVEKEYISQLFELFRKIRLGVDSMKMEHSLLLLTDRL